MTRERKRAIGLLDLLGLVELGKKMTETYEGGRPWRVESASWPARAHYWYVAHGPPYDPEDCFDLFDGQPPKEVCEYVVAAKDALDDLEALLDALPTLVDAAESHLEDLRRDGAGDRATICDAIECVKGCST